MNDDVEKVFSRVQECMEALVGGSGHLGSYTLKPDTFEVVEVEEVDVDKKRYYFKVKGYRESEFTEHDEADGPAGSGAELLEGSITLDSNYDFVADERGDVLFEPWKSIVLALRQPMLSAREKAKHLLYDKLKMSLDIVQMVSSECSLKWANQIKNLLDDIQLRLDGAKSGPVDHVSLQDILFNSIMGVMDQDLLAPEDELGLLMTAFQNRLEHFDEYFEKLHNNELKGPFVPMGKGSGKGSEKGSEKGSD